MASQSQSDLPVIKRLLFEARSYWAYLGLILAVELLSTPLSLLAPLPLMLVVDSVIGSAPLPGFIQAITPDSIEQSKSGLLITLAIFVVVLAILNQLRGITSVLLKTHINEKLTLRFRARLLSHAQRVSLAYHDRQGTADSLYRIQHDAPAISGIIVSGITPFITAGFTLISMIIITASVDLQLALIALTVSPVVALLTYIIRKRLRRQWRHVRRLESSALKILKETLGSLRVVKAFGQEQREHHRFVSRATEGYGARIQAIKGQNIFGFFVGTTLAVGTALVLFVGVQHVEQGTLTLGALLLVMSYLGQLYNPLESLGTQVTRLQRNLVGAERAFALFDMPSEVIDKPDAEPLEKAEGDIEFQAVVFGYDPGRPVLHDLSFHVPKGARVGIAGKTGAGKSTIVNLLIRFYDPDSGQILIDGRDIKDYRLADLRNQFAIVLQEPIIFSGSVAENISYGRADASLEEIMQAADAANASDFIDQLPEKFDTPLGERGMLLSGGQRQRIALARAFLKDAPVLILDEPTSSVDVKTEADIMVAMDRIMAGRTTFIIAHRLSTLDNCDFVLVVEEGKLIKVSPDMVPKAVMAV